MLVNYRSNQLNYSFDSNPPTRAYIVLWVCYTWHILALIVVSARILVKVKLGRFGKEDVLILIATV